MLSTTNWIERLHRAYRRVLRMRGALPDESSLLVLLARIGMSRKSIRFQLMANSGP